ncbi:hypothetical protein IAU59_001754 [Kwoniella sp. CBS 9459]
MTAMYKDKNGKEYGYYQKYGGSEGDLIIISSENLALRTDRNILKAHSSVFRTMFSTCDGNNDHVNLDHEAGTIALYLDAMADRSEAPGPAEWKQFREAVELCIRYDTPAVGAQMLKNIPKIDHFGWGVAYGIFLLAAEFDDVLTACRIIGGAGRYRPDDFFRGNSWSKEVMETLPSRWVWAYMAAHQDCDLPYKHTVDYWEKVAVVFLRKLLPGVIRIKLLNFEA